MDIEQAVFEGQDELPEEFTTMSVEDIERRTRLLQVRK